MLSDKWRSNSYWIGGGFVEIAFILNNTHTTWLITTDSVQADEMWTSEFFK